MRILKTVKIFYIVYTVYTILIMLCSDYPVRYAVLGMIAMWMVYCMFSVGYRAKTTSNQNDNRLKPSQDTFFMSGIAQWSRLKYILVAVACWGCTIIAAQYYTGRGFGEVIGSLSGGSNAYRDYQQYFRANNMAAFSLSKIPYILMLTFLTIVLFWSLVSILQLSHKTKLRQGVFLASVVLSYLYFGVARGTNFELYIVFIIVSYCLLNKAGQNGQVANQKINYKNIVLVGISGVIMVIVFFSVVDERGVTFGNAICGEIYYDDKKLLSQLLPNLTQTLSSIFSYLGFGIYTIGVTMAEVIAGSTASLFSSFLPGYSNMYDPMQVQLARHVEIGVRWVPDLITFTNDFGIILTLVLAFLLGKIIRKMQNSTFPRLLSELLMVIIYIEMLSLPVGNFFANSTPNKLFIVVVIVCMLSTKIKIKF